MARSRYVPIVTDTALNGIHIPLAALPSALGRCALTLFVVNDDPIYKASLRGSATCLLVHNHYIVACCYHQFKDIDPQKIGLLTKGGETLVTSGGVRHFIDRNDSEFHDLALFDFTEPCQAIPELREHFHRFVVIPPAAPSDDAMFVQVSGFPIADQTYDLAENNHISLAKRHIHCDILQPSHDESVVLLGPHKPLDFLPDGLSGGPAFTVQRIGNQPTCWYRDARRKRQDLYPQKRIHSVSDPCLPQLVR
ncbi:hypothetical protein [Rhizobium wenxiniae]|uniref:Uncharacterized protein n=2 Tax=Rhizobium TaxID=379 RepID=A0A7W9YBM0_9HYPH|nr:hypothetical protein [Rhizobium wenxiniae]MBB6165574.1 hypothetical protein [Rhizobium wenxiniae]